MTDLLTELEALAKEWEEEGPDFQIGEDIAALRLRSLIAAEKARGPDPLQVKERDWSKIRDYFDCLGDSEEEKQLRIRWVREMKAENKELRAALATPDPLLVQAREALEFDAQASEAAEQHDCGGRNECTYAQINFKGCFHDEIWDALKEAKVKKRAALAALDARLGGKA